MALYTSVNNNGDPIAQSCIDSGVYSAPTDRPTTFTPIGGYTLPTTTGQANFGASGNDWSVATTPGKRAQCFEAPSFTCLIDPGLQTSG